MDPVPRKSRSARAIAARLDGRAGGPGADLWLERAAFILGVILFVLSVVALRVMTEPAPRLVPQAAEVPLSVLEWNDHAQEA